MARHQDRTHNQLPKDWNAAEREKQVVALRLQGLEFAAIAEQVGYANGSGAHKAWKRVLARMPLVETKQEREESKMRLNIALAAIWPKVLSGDTWAIKSLIDIEKRRAELMGLDMVATGGLPEGIRREYYGVDVASLEQRLGETVSPNGRSKDTVHP